ncbi:hypothetical protein [Lichenifustis flavocetrariae]|uniref:Uncharacterized protein n=1 Tax=Lichenifustis flavocetrariae TaxID=2949735 RepID=A0AA41Z2Q8_9HYPH|nr:hypothetical protein [Lichenifustis flavocetrariae]MCW6511902.1 hypothetical protein [Lichenifustis flavocetrariae]
MARPAAFASLPPSLNPFLYSGVGTELNGSELTVLSILARLGFDPWIEAGRLVTLPKAVAASWFAERISQMPLTAPALAGAAETASRLVALLPADAQVIRVGSKSEAAGQVDAARTPHWAMLLMVLCALALGAVASSHSPAAQTTSARSEPIHLDAIKPQDGTGVTTPVNRD